MRADHLFWAVLLGTVLVWYAGVTIYVAVRGLRDIREMTRRLSGARDRETGSRGTRPVSGPGAP